MNTTISSVYHGNYGRAEIERTFSKRQSEELKAFITRKKDIFRPPYGRSALEFARQSIIVGTANGSDFLVDSTGNRRYWIIPVAHSKIDIKRLKQERDRIVGCGEGLS